MSDPVMIDGRPMRWTLHPPAELQSLQHDWLNLTGRLGRPIPLDFDFVESLLATFEPPAVRIARLGNGRDTSALAILERQSPHLASPRPGAPVAARLAHRDVRQCALGTVADRSGDRSRARAPGAPPCAAGTAPAPVARRARSRPPPPPRVERPDADARPY